jgi:hypothetical protein
MKAKKTITIEVEMFSDASEAHLNQHLDEFVNEIKYNCENMRFQSWHKSIATSWDKSYPVEISVNFPVK